MCDTLFIGVPHEARGAVADININVRLVLSTARFLTVLSHNLAHLLNWTYLISPGTWFSTFIRPEQLATHLRGPVLSDLFHSRTFQLAVPGLIRK